MTALEHELRALAGEVEWPPAANLAPAVRERIERERTAAGPAHRRLRSRRPLRLVPALPRSPLAIVAVALVALIVAVALVPPARSAILRVLGVTHGARIVRVEPPPRVSHGPLDLGREMPLARAQSRLAFRVRLPAGLGAPRRTRYSDRIAGGAVTLYWPGYVLTEFQGQGVPFFQKFATRDTRVRRVRVGGGPAYFLSGAPHELFIADRNGEPLAGESALVDANVLLWDARSGLSFRLETRRGLADALAVARSVAR